MFSDNLKAIRKAKGYTQEELAIKLNVVRQTVSKWEKGLSAPDADVLSKIADVLDTKVSVLLGGAISEEDAPNAVAEQLAKISEQMAIRNRRSKRIWKTVGILLLAVVVFMILLVMLNAVSFRSYSDSSTTVLEMNVEDTTD